MGPGRYSDTKAMISSKLVVLACASIFFMPLDSNWNTAVVLASRKIL